MVQTPKNRNGKRIPKRCFLGTYAYKLDWTPPQTLFKIRAVREGALLAHDSRYPRIMQNRKNGLGADVRRVTPERPERGTKRTSDERQLPELDTNGRYR